MARLRDVIAPMLTASRHVDWVTANRRASSGELLRPGAARAAGCRSGRPERLIVDLIPRRHARIASAFMTLDQLRWLPDDVLQKADRATMMTSLEMRTPYLSRDLVELAASIPLSVHMRDGGKYVLRQVLARMGAPLTSRRTKRAFRVPLAEWLRDPLAPLLAEQLASSAVYTEGWFDRDAVRRLVDEHDRRVADHSAVLWPLITFACWLDAWRARMSRALRVLTITPDYPPAIGGIQLLVHRVLSHFTRVQTRVVTHRPIGARRSRATLTGRAWCARHGRRAIASRSRS